MNGINIKIEEHALEAPIQIGLSHHSKNPKYQNFIEPILRFREVERREAGSAYKFCMMLEGEIDIYPRFIQRQNGIPVQVNRYWKVLVVV
jgi:3'-phosphoadenosine 5'-phosphosulfate (PAPS) 3'-phosphatase